MIEQTHQPSVFVETLRAIARSTAALARPLAGRRWFRIWAVVHHVGRMSGRAYAIPVAIAHTEDGFIIPTPFGPSTQWVRNVLAAGGCTVRWNGTDHVMVDPAVVGRDVAAPAFGRLPRIVLGSLGFDRFLSLRYPSSIGPASSASSESDRAE